MHILQKHQYHFWPYLTQFFLEWEIFQMKVVEKIKPHILRSVTFFEYSAIYEIMLKNIEQATDVNKAHALFVLNN